MTKTVPFGLDDVETKTASLGLDDAQSPLAVLIDGEARPLVALDHADGSLWVPTALSEQGLDEAIRRLDPMPEWKPNAWWIAWVEEATILRDLAGAPDGGIAGIIVFDEGGWETRRERCR